MSILDSKNANKCNDWYLISFYDEVIKDEINNSSVAIEAEKKETYPKGHQNGKREMLLHEKKGNVDSKNMMIIGKANGIELKARGTMKSACIDKVTS